MNNILLHRKSTRKKEEETGFIVHPSKNWLFHVQLLLLLFCLWLSLFLSLPPSLSLPFVSFLCHELCPLSLHSSLITVSSLFLTSLSLLLFRLVCFLLFNGPVSHAVPPANIDIVSPSGQRLEGVIGPYREGDAFRVICQSQGGQSFSLLLRYHSLSSSSETWNITFTLYLFKLKSRAICSLDVHLPLTKPTSSAFATEIDCHILLFSSHHFHWVHLMSLYFLIILHSILLIFFWQQDYSLPALFLTAFIPRNSLP